MVAITRRRGDGSQLVRSWVQFGFGFVALLVGAQFYLWVRYYETGGAGWKMSRPPGLSARSHSASGATTPAFT